MKVTSSAALGTLTVASSDLQSDLALALVVSLASKLQLTVLTSSKNESRCLQLELPSGVVLSHRNAILRCLCGMGLHNALDDALLGGHNQARLAAPEHALALAGIASWMSVADHHHATDAAGTPQDLLPQLETHLATRSFLVTSATPTLADVTVATVVAPILHKNHTTGIPHVLRWLRTVAALLATHGIVLDVPAQADNNNDMSPPMCFFYGTETDVSLPTVVSKPAAASAPKPPPQPQHHQQQQSKKKPQQPKQPPAPASSSFDISALDIRVGTILKAWEHADADKLYCEEIDVGDDNNDNNNSTPRQIASGLRPFYATPDDLQGRRVMVLCNLKARNLVGFPSHGMVLCASNADHSSVELMEPPEGAKNGERIVFEGYEEGAPEPENKVAKKKIFEGLAPDLKTNAEGICVWKGALSKTSAGPVKASKGMANAQVA